MAVLSVPLRRAEVDPCFSTLRLLLVDPILNVRSAETPKLSDANTVDTSSSRQLLQSLRMNLYDSRGFLCIE